MKTILKSLPLIVISLFMQVTSPVHAGDYDYCEPIITPIVYYYGDGTGHEIEFFVTEIDDFCTGAALSPMTYGLQMQTYYSLLGTSIPESVTHMAQFDNNFPFPMFSLTIDVTDNFLQNHHKYRAWMQVTYGDSAPVTVYTPWIEGTDPVTRSGVGGDIPDDFIPLSYDEPTSTEIPIQGGMSISLKQLRQP